VRENYRDITADGEYYNFSVDYEELEVQYDNEFTAIAHIVDSDGQKYEYNMSHTDKAGSRLWNLTLPNSEWLSKDYIMWFDVQNGNSSTKLIGGRVQPMSKGSFFVLGPYHELSSERAWDKNYTFTANNRAQTSTFTKHHKLNIYRSIESILINGTLGADSRLREDDFTDFWVEFRRGGTQNYNDWHIIPTTSGFMDYNNVTGVWNVTYPFLNTFPAGQYFYRLKLQTIEKGIYASAWCELRIHNFQPQDFTINSFPTSGNYLRENTIVNFDIDISDIESDETGLQSSFLLECLDRTPSHDPYSWSKIADTQTTTPLGGNLYNLAGTFKYSRSIHIGPYNEIYVIVTDDDPYWPQTGKLRVPDFGVNITNNAPVMSMAIDSDKADDSVFRNNSMLVHWNITDLDDWDYQNFTIHTWTIDYPNATQEVYNEGNRAGIIEYNGINHRWEYDRFYTRYDSFGTYAFTINFEDPDSKSTSYQYFNPEIKNNLPTLVNMTFENLDRPNMTVELLLNRETGEVINDNLSDFIVYRASDNIRFTLNVTDVEDSYMPIRDNNITEVYFKLENRKFTIDDVYTGASQDSRDYSTFVMNKSGSVDGVETWISEFQLPGDADFYAIWNLPLEFH